MTHIHAPTNFPPQADMLLSSDEDDGRPAPSRGGKKGARVAGSGAAGMTVLQAVLASDNDVVRAVQVGAAAPREGGGGRGRVRAGAYMYILSCLSCPIYSYWLSRRHPPPAASRPRAPSRRTMSARWPPRVTG